MLPVTGMRGSRYQGLTTQVEQITLKKDGQTLVLLTIRIIAILSLHLVIQGHYNDALSDQSNELQN